MKKFLFGVALLALPASTAFAVGVDIQWNECIGAATDATTQTFACTGTANKNYHLVFQMKVGQNMDHFVAATAIIDVGRALPPSLPQGPLSPFWHYEDAGCQRSGTIKGLAMFDNPALIIPGDPIDGCVAQEGDSRMSDPWGGDGSGGTEGIAVYLPDYNGQNGKGRFGLVDASGADSPLTAGVNYYLFHLTFNNRNKTAGTGCTDPMVIVFNSVTLESSDGSPAVFLFTQDKGDHCGVLFTQGANDATNCAATPTRNTTWGQLKAMYR